MLVCPHTQTHTDTLTAHDMTFGPSSTVTLRNEHILKLTNLSSCSILVASRVYVDGIVLEKKGQTWAAECSYGILANSDYAEAH